MRQIPFRMNSLLNKPEYKKSNTLQENDQMSTLSAHLDVGAQSQISKGIDGYKQDPNMPQIQEDREEEEIGFDDRIVPMDAPYQEDFEA